MGTFQHAACWKVPINTTTIMHTQSSNNKAKRPVFIVGCTRSGTKLVSRILGGHPDNFLITEHREKFHIPEDRSGVCEEYLWWNNFAFPTWARDGSPIIRTPLWNEEDCERLRRVFLSLAGAKRLIVKNPQDLLRLKCIRTMFPDALYIFCVRNPWHGLQSRIIGGKQKYLLGSADNAKLPDDLLLRSIYSWKDSIDIYEKEKDANWLAVRYEDVVFNTKETLTRLFTFIGMEPAGPYFEKVCALPKDLEHTFYPVKRAFRKSPFKKEIMEIVKAGARVFPYDTSIDSVPGTAWKYYLREKKILDAKRLFRAIEKAIKPPAKSALRLIWNIGGGRKKLYARRLFFGALAEGGSTLVVEDDAPLRDALLRGKKGERVSLSVNQMQYQRLKHWRTVSVLNQKGAPVVLLTDVDFRAAERYTYVLTGSLTYMSRPR